MSAISEISFYSRHLSFHALLHLLPHWFFEMTFLTPIFQGGRLGVRSPTERRILVLRFTGSLEATGSNPWSVWLPGHAHHLRAALLLGTSEKRWSTIPVCPGQRGFPERGSFSAKTQKAPEKPLWSGKSSSLCWGHIAMSHLCLSSFLWWFGTQGLWWDLNPKPWLLISLPHTLTCAASTPRFPLPLSPNEALGPWPAVRQAREACPSAKRKQIPGLTAKVTESRKVQKYPAFCLLGRLHFLFFFK